MNRYNSFDGLRGYSAIGILLMHYLANFDKAVVSQLEISLPFIYKQLIPFFTTLVFLFFILSAFSMCCGYFNRFALHKICESDGKECFYSKFDTDSFYKKRYTRIWPFFALLVVMDFIMKPSVSEFYQAFADLTLAFNLLPNPDISVIGVGWFLGLVFVFYMIFPWFVFLLHNKYRAWFALIISLIFHVILVRYFLTSEFCTESQISNFRHNMIFSFMFFMEGGVLYLYRDCLKFKKASSRVLLFVGAFFSTFLIFTPLSPKPFGESLLWINVAFLLWIIYAMTGGCALKGFKLLDNKVANFLGNLSMEIYLCHMVLFRVVEKIHLERYVQNVHALYWLWCLLGLLLTIIFSYVVTVLMFPFIGKMKKKML